jgi:hypothetical protein
LCPNCLHPLILDDADDKPDALAATGLHKPTEARNPDATVIASVPIAPTYPPPTQVGPGRQCPNCGHVNPPAQMRCERCATSLEQQFAPPPLPPPPPPPPPNRTGLAVALVALAVVLAVVLGYVAFRVARPIVGPSVDPGVTAGPTTPGQPSPTPEPSPTLTAEPSPTPEPELKRIKKVKAKASSTLPPNNYNYDVENTLDRDPTTAWNSNGNVVGAFARVTLTYRFSKPVQLRAIEIYNGYQRSEETFYNNSRVRRLLVSTDATKQSFRLLDQQGEQTLTFDFGQTAKVVLTIEAVYRDDNTRYKDCAISDVTFFRV